MTNNVNFDVYDDYSRAKLFFAGVSVYNLQLTQSQINHALWRADTNVDVSFTSSSVNAADSLITLVHSVNTIPDPNASPSPSPTRVCDAVTFQTTTTLLLNKK